MTGLLFATASSSSAGRVEAALNLRAVNWSAVTLPPVCGGSQPINLHRLGSPPVPIAIGSVTPIPQRWSWADFYGRRSVQVWAGWEPVLYGDLDGQHDAAVDFACTNGGGTADGELLEGWVVFSGQGGRLSVVGVVTPRAKHPPTDPTTTIEIKISPTKIVAVEYWFDYEPRASNLVRVSRWAVTIWAYAHGTLRPGTPVVTNRPPPGWLHIKL